MLKNIANYFSRHKFKKRNFAKMKHFRDLFVSVEKIWRGVESQQISLLACLSTEFKKKIK